MKAMEINQAKFPEVYADNKKKKMMKSSPPSSSINGIPVASPVFNEEKDLILDIKESEASETEPIVENIMPLVKENECLPAKKKSSKKKDISISLQEVSSQPPTETVELASLEYIVTEPPLIPKHKKNKASSKSKASENGGGDAATSFDRGHPPIENSKSTDENVLSQEEWDIMQTLMLNKKPKKAKSEPKN